MPQSKHCKAIALPLRLLLLLPVVLQVVAIAALVGNAMLRSGRRTIALMAGQLIEETSNRVTQELDNYLQTAQQINQNHAAALKAGVLNPQNLDQLHHYLILELQQHHDLTTLTFTTPDGDTRGIRRIESGQIDSGFTRLNASAPPFEAMVATPQMPTELTLYSIDAVGNLVRPVLTLKDFNIRERAWYRQAVERGEPGWSAPFRIGATNLLAINTHLPAYDDAQNLQGVFGVHLSLHQIGKFLSRLELGETGAVFIIDAEGRLIADSVKDTSYFVTAVPPDGPDRTTDQALTQTLATKSRNVLVSSAAQHLVAQFEHFNHIQTRQQLTAQIENERHFLQVVPYRSFQDLDWLIVTVVPEYSFTGEIYASLRRMAIVLAGTLVGAIAVCFWVAQRVTRPITALGQDAQALLRGNVIRSAHLTRITEVDALQHRFYQMAHRLKELLSDLERQVQHRTAKLTQSEASLKEAQRIARMGSWVLDVETEAMTWSETLLWLDGTSRIKPLSSYAEFLSYLPPDDCYSLQAAVSQTIATGQSYEIEHRFELPDSETCLYLANRGEAVFNEQGNVEEIVGTVVDISDRKRMELELRILATVDDLTQVANRRQLESSLAHEWRRHFRSQRPLTMIMIDIDHFKPFNDRYGHPAGDRCLRQVGQVLKAAANRPSDLVARYGGEEFMLLLPDTDVSGAIAMASHIQSALSALAIPHLDSKPGYVTVSMGVLVVCVSENLTADDAIAEADTALYCAKQARNTYCIQHIPCHSPMEPASSIRF